MIKKIQHNEKLLAIIVSSQFKKQGIEFFTPDDFSQQLAYMHRPKNYSITPHSHNTVERNVSLTNEVLFIKSGKIRVDFYDDDRNYLESRVLEKDDVILLCHGGHGFEMLEDTEIIEVKQGPFTGDQDKTRFEGISKEKLRIL